MSKRIELASEILKQGYPVVQEGFSSKSMVNSLIRILNAIEHGVELYDESCETEEISDIREAPDITVEQALNVLIKNLKEDEQYFDTWKANIAVAIKDEIRVDYFEQNGDNMCREDLATLHRVSNNAAERFLKNLIVYK